MSQILNSIKPFVDFVIGVLQKDCKSTREKEMFWLYV